MIKLTKFQVVLAQVKNLSSHLDIQLQRICLPPVPEQVLTVSELIVSASPTELRRIALRDLFMAKLTSKHMKSHHQKIVRIAKPNKMPRILIHKKVTVIQTAKTMIALTILKLTMMTIFLTLRRQSCLIKRTSFQKFNNYLKTLNLP